MGIRRVGSQQVVGRLLSLLTLRGRRVPWAMVIVAALAPACAAGAGEVPVDFSRYHSGPVAVRFVEPSDPSRLLVEWPVGEGESARLVLSTRPGASLVESLRVVVAGAGAGLALLENVEPVTFLTVGSRNGTPDQPPGMSVFNTFFDSPAQRPHESFRAKLEIERIGVVSSAQRVSIVVDRLTAGSFRGSLHLTVYPGVRLVHVEAVLRTDEAQRAYLYDAGLAGTMANASALAWVDTEGRLQCRPINRDAADAPIAVRHRTLFVESAAGTVGVFPPPHQFFTPRDYTDNLKTVWFGRDHRGLEPRFGFGVRQSETGGGRFAPWFNAPPGTDQRLGVFYVFSTHKAEEALGEALRWTRGDRFAEVPGYKTFTSHWHMATAVAAMAEEAKGAGRSAPDFVKMFHEMGVNIVHLAEFHGDGHQKDPGPHRWPELEAMFAECRRLSDSRLLFLPGEEVDTFLAEPGHPPGHWMCLFPRPVFWAMSRKPGEPFAFDLPQGGRAYRVGSREDMVRLLAEEHGLAWSSHPRIKASNWTPDAFRERDFYKGPTWLGAAWKAMPADLSNPQLGRRALDLLDDMANWGDRKYLPGEVDVFKVDHTHELFGHMNVNYLRLDRVPKFDESWQPVLDALRAGKFFVTTGEILLREFTVGGKSSGQTLAMPSEGRAEVQLRLEWTFPLRFVDLVSGDGSRVFRERIDGADSGAFGERTITLKADLAGRKWVRAEAWDVAGNGGFTQPVWLERK